MECVFERIWYDNLVVIPNLKLDIHILSRMLKFDSVIFWYSEISLGQKHAHVSYGFLKSLNAFLLMLQLGKLKIPTAKDMRHIDRKLKSCWDPSTQDEYFLLPLAEFFAPTLTSYMSPRLVTYYFLSLSTETRNEKRDQSTSQKEQQLRCKAVLLKHMVFLMHILGMLMHANKSEFWKVNTTIGSFWFTSWFPFFFPTTDLLIYGPLLNFYILSGNYSWRMLNIYLKSMDKLSI